MNQPESRTIGILCIKCHKNETFIHQVYDKRISDWVTTSSYEDYVCQECKEREEKEYDSCTCKNY